MEFNGSTTTTTTTTPPSSLSYSPLISSSSSSPATSPTTSAPPPLPPAVVVSPCAACKTLRRRCVERCVLAPYFPPSEPLKFTIAHRVFGASNIIKFLQVCFNSHSIYFLVHFELIITITHQKYEDSFQSSCITIYKI